MSYSTGISGILTKLIEKFVTLNRYQLAGHAANLDFWTTEVLTVPAIPPGSAFDSCLVKSGKLG
jgi:hypothetical protein